MDSSNKNPFYVHFIDIDKLREVKQKDKKLFCKYYFSVAFFLFLFGIIIHFFGFYLEGDFHRIIFYIDCGFLLNAVYSTFRALWLDHKYKVFRKRWMPYLFIGGSYLIAFTMFLTAYLTVSVEVYENGYILSMSNQWLFLVYFVLGVVYFTFCSKAYINIFAMFKPDNVKLIGKEP